MAAGSVTDIRFPVVEIPKMLLTGKDSRNVERSRRHGGGEVILFHVVV
jgi:hypothetical protein